MDDVMTLAHELGHGMHFALASATQTALSFGTGIALAEVPSTFAELLAFDHLMELESDPSTRRSLISERVEGSFATVFRQTVLTRYEQRAYALRAEGGTLTADRLSEIWFEENAKYYGDTVGLPERYRMGWSYIPHFISTRFYTYAYVFAHLAGAVCPLSRSRCPLRRRLHRVPVGGRVGGADRAAGPAGRGRRRPGRLGAGLPGDGADGRGGRGGLTGSPPRVDQPLEAFLEAFSGLSAFWTCSGSSVIG
jgi:hypothetical protein